MRGFACETKRVRTRSRRKSRRWEDYVVPIMLTAASLLLVTDIASSSMRSENRTVYPRINLAELALPHFMRKFGDEQGVARFASLGTIKVDPLAGWGGRDGLDAVRPRHKLTDFNSRNQTIIPASGSGESPTRITSGFGYRKLQGYVTHHDGIDLGLPHGAPIKAAWGGEVVYAGWQNGYGNAVIIDHGNGKETLYAHASRILVVKGQKVKGGDVIARVGNTGRSYGAHLHFELRINGTPIDPERHYLASVAVRPTPAAE